MPTPLDHQVFQALSRSRATLERSAWLTPGLAVAQWRNARDATAYSTPGHHTLGCYLEGGHDTHRRGQPHHCGAPDRLCILPAEHQSAWVVNGPLRFVHLYVGPELFALGALQLLDREPRELQLQERIFIEQPALATGFRQLCRLSWSEPGERLYASGLAQALLDETLLQQTGRRDGLTVRGGLAAWQRHRLIDFIEAHLEQPLEVQQLAAQVHLSPYHFSRMFRLSFGMAPHQYLQARRLQLAQQLLRNSTLALGEIALRCGYSSASHFSNRFKQTMKATPGDYRRALQG